MQKNGNNYVMNILDERLDKLKDKKGYEESLLRLEIKDGSTDIMVGGLDVQIQNSDSTSFMIPDRLAVGYKLPIGDITPKAVTFRDFSAQNAERREFNKTLTYDDWD